jgi:hypothetical protein
MYAFKVCPNLDEAAEKTLDDLQPTHILEQFWRNCCKNRYNQPSGR